MNKLSNDFAERTRKIESVILQRFAKRTARDVAETVGVHESTVSRWKEEKLSMVAQVLVALDLQVVSNDTLTIEHDEKLSLMRLAKKHLETEIAREEILSKNEKAHAGTWADSSIKKGN